MSLLAAVLLSAARRLTMQKYARASLLPVVAFLTFACSDTDARLFPTQPEPRATSSLVIEPSPAIAVAEPVLGSRCPAVSPFNVAFGLSVSTNDWSSVLVTGIRAQFVDTSGVQARMVTLPMPPITQPAPGPTQQFAIPLSLGIGCGTGTHGTIVVIVDTTDGRGRRGSQEVVVVVR